MKPKIKKPAGLRSAKILPKMKYRPSKSSDNVTGV